MSDRPVIEADEINATISELQRKLRDKLNEKGPGSFASRHEILGALQEEWDELKEVVHSGTLSETKDELFDLAVGAVFSAACISAGKVDW